MKHIRLFTLIALALVLLASCATSYDYTQFTEDEEGWAPVVEYWAAKNAPAPGEPVKIADIPTDVIKVKDFASFKAAFSTAKRTGIKNIVFDADITWDPAETELALEATGLTIDLNGHTIKNIAKNALNFTGDSFTIKNGSILAAEGNNRYSININYDGTNGIKELALPKVPGAYDDSDPVWAKRVVVENLTATGMLIGYSTAEVKNSQFIGGTYRGLVFQGSSGIVENVTVACADGAGSAGFVAHSYGVVTVKGECNFASKFGIYTAFCGKCIIDPAAKVTVRAYETVGIYAETQGTSEIYGTIDITPAPSKKAYIVRTGASSTIEKGAKFIVNGSEPAVGAIVAADGNAYVDFKTGAGDKDKNYKGYGVDGFITDLR